MIRAFLLFFLARVACLAQLSPVAEAWKNDKDLKSASISYCVVDAATASLVSEYNSHLALIPASTLKIVTTSAAMGLLGNGFRYETKLFYTGTFNKQSGVLNGDLVISGSGDPTLQSENFIRDSTVRVTDKWAQALKEKGIREITGSIIGDASCFERTVPDNWIWGDIGNYFGAAPCGLSFMDNKFKLIYATKEVGSKAELISIHPNYLKTPITVTSNIIARGSDDEASIYGDPFSYHREASGRIPAHKTAFPLEATLPDPALLCAEMLYTSLIKAGIVCSKQSIVSNYKKTDTLQGKQWLYTHFSPSLDKIILFTNLKSNNLYCESLLRTMGKGNLAAGIDAVRNYWQKKGLDISELFMADGCGLSRANTLTTSLQVLLLSKIYKDSVNYKAFNLSLPVAGKSGSMSTIGKGKPIENNLRAKTGYINRVRGYCGYVRSQSGRDLAFSVLFNNYTCSAQEAKLKLEKFMVELGNL